MPNSISPSAHLVIEYVDQVSGEKIKKVYILNDFNITQSKNVHPTYSIDQQVLGFFSDKEYVDFSGSGYLFWNGNSKRCPNLDSKIETKELPSEFWHLDLIDLKE